MACYYPQTAFRPKQPGLSGKRQVSFHMTKFHTEAITLPCGQCIGCRLEKSRQWSIRIMHEAQMHDYNSFLTLTYDEKHLPEDGSLKKQDLQKFFKRLRKKLGENTRIRYYACGEYGDTTERAHYHVCLFGWDFPDKTKFKRNGQGDWLYVSPVLESTWGKGQCLVGDLTVQSAGYTARYVMKKVKGKNEQEHYKRTNPETGEIYNRTPEFAVMSRRPGIGREWFDKYRTDLYPSDSVIHNTRETKIPSYYDRLLEQEDPALLEALKERRVSKAQERAHEQLPHRRKARETVKRAQLKMLTRNEI